MGSGRLDSLHMGSMSFLARNGLQLVPESLTLFLSMELIRGRGQQSGSSPQPTLDCPGVVAAVCPCPIMAGGSQEALAVLLSSSGCGSGLGL